jgi:RNA polymerase sigma-70 factor (ECF subfamily)
MSEAIKPESFGRPEFVARIQARDQEAIQAVVHAYLDQILRAARGAGLNQERAEDVTQATFLTFVEAAPRFEGRSHVRTWLFGILYRKVSEARRAAQRESRLDDIDEVMEHRFNTKGYWSQPPRPADWGVYSEELRRHIEECIETASTQQRMAFLLREVEGFTSEQICNALDITLTNLGVLLYRVRNTLRECLETRGIKG